jgi:hypothetical protein
VAEGDGEDEEGAVAGADEGGADTGAVAELIGATVGLPGPAVAVPGAVTGTGTGTNGDVVGEFWVCEPAGTGGAAGSPIAACSGFAGPLLVTAGAGVDAESVGVRAGSAPVACSELGADTGVDG